MSGGVSSPRVSESVSFQSEATSNPLVDSDEYEESEDKSGGSDGAAGAAPGSSAVADPSESASPPHLPASPVRPFFVGGRVKVEDEVEEEDEDDTGLEASPGHSEEVADPNVVVEVKEQVIKMRK